MTNSIKELYPLSIDIPNKIGCLKILQSFVVESAKLLDIDKKNVSKLELICEEALTYVMQASFDKDEDSRIKIELGIDDSHFRISFFDKGLPYDESLSPSYEIKKDIEDISSLKGMELFFLKKFTKQLEWINHGNSGKELRLLLPMPYSDITELDTVKEKSDDRSVDASQILIRKMQPSDAISIARVIYRTYGYTYPNEDMYYPQKIQEFNASFKLVSIVCIDESTHELIGHYALERESLGIIAESGQAVVMPQYRGLNLMSKMRYELENCAKELKLEGTMAQPVTTHTFSQKVNIKNGSKVCGISFGLVPKELNFKAIASPLSQRESCMLYFKLLKNRKRNIYIPKKHQDMITKIYNNIGLDYLASTKQSNKKSANIDSSYNTSWGFGVINVEEIALDSLPQIKTALHHLRLDLSADVIFLYISLEHATIDELVEDIEKLGFFFCGITPSFLNGKDVIRFEYLNTMIDTAKIKVESDIAKELFEYVKNQMQRVLL